MSDSSKQDWRSGFELEYRRKRQSLLDELDKIEEQITKLKNDAVFVADEIGRLDEAADVFGVPLPQEIEFKRLTGKSPSSRDMQFKDIALEYLKDAYPETRTAAEIQQTAEDILRRNFHPKTAGMTLYRFSQEGAVERIGKSNWRYVPKEEGPEHNPEPSFLS